MSYRYRNLTHAIEDPDSPLREYFHRRFPNVRPVQDGYRQASGPLVVDTVTANAGTVGAAFDFLLRFRLDAGYRPRVAAAAASIAEVPEHVATVYDVAAAAVAAVHSAASGEAPTVAVRACWALALTTELYRNPLLVVGSAPAELIRSGDFTTASLLALAPDDVVELVSSLYTAAATGLAGILTAEHDEVVPGAAFEASRLCAAEADIVVDGTLIELRTRLGSRNKKSGLRSDSLPRNDIYQVLGCALFDTADRYRLTEVGVYSARYGTLHRWPLQPLVDTLAGEPVDLAAERAAVWALLDVHDDETAPSAGTQDVTVSSPGTASPSPDPDSPSPDAVLSPDEVSAIADTDASADPVSRKPEAGLAPDVTPAPDTASRPPQTATTAENGSRRGWKRLTQWGSRVARPGRRGGRATGDPH
ncbi:hypothetical protein [Nocardia sp. alder85J]|uniref:hypothetical protein n=1 Tax=Nocardia sp. alder85J TaxID=2862949 RepID=UPI001CD38B58|nr:hypothetical protein [Nocardia sp. alder85J]MCX4091596.1 hypothetical protein [Nocardia sp. alder85J]